MASLSTILQTKGQDISFTETNIEKGEIYYFNPGTVTSSAGETMSWTAPADGTASIEIWGASGSGGKMCCCGAGVPGNPGAYSKKSVRFLAGDTITATIGRSCPQTDVVSCRGRSEPTCLCWVSAALSSDGTMCADGGIGGMAYCGGSGNSHYCCFVINSYCTTQIGSTGCGLVCNRKTDADIALSSGGDLNCPGGFSCVHYRHCNSCCTCSQYHHVKTSPGVFAIDGAVITFSGEAQGDTQQGHGGSYFLPFMSALNAASRSPSYGQHPTFCWAGARICSCYERHGCFPYLPHGVPGVSGTPCSSIRDPGMKGGHGAVRIRFIGS